MTKKQKQAEEMQYPPVVERITHEEYLRRRKAYLRSRPDAGVRRGFFGGLLWQTQQEAQLAELLKQQGVARTNPMTEQEWIAELEDIAAHNPQAVIESEAYHRVKRMNPALRGLSAEALAVVRAAEDAYYWKPPAATPADEAGEGGSDGTLAP